MLAAELARLHSDLLALGEQVPERLPAAEVDALFAAFRGVQGAVATVRSKLVRCAQLSRAPEEGGHSGAPSYLKERLGLSGSDAAKQDKLAKDLERLPGTAAALAAGELGPDQAAAIGHAARRGALGDPKATEEQLLDIARSSDTDGLRRRIRVEEQRADRERLVRDERLAHSRRSARLSRRDDGMWNLHAQLTGEFGEMLAVALDAHRTKDGPDVPLPQQRSYEQRTADALAAVISSAMDGGSAVSQGGARPQLHIVVPHDVLDEAGQGVARTERGGPLSPVLIERLLCDAQMRRVLTDGRSEVLDLGRLREKWTVGQRRALHIRDGGCRGPGCDRPATSCHAHHVRWWSKGGDTAVRNGILLCSYHHHLVHEGGWGLEFDARTGRAVFTAPGGHQLVTLPTGLPVTRPHAAAAGQSAAASVGDLAATLGDDEDGAAAIGVAPGTAGGSRAASALEHGAGKSPSSTSALEPGAAGRSAAASPFGPGTPVSGRAVGGHVGSGQLQLAQLVPASDPDPTGRAPP